MGGNKVLRRPWKPLVEFDFPLSTWGNHWKVVSSSEKWALLQLGQQPAWLRRAHDRRSRVTNKETSGGR